MTSKKGTPILPAANDWSIGINATPFINYAGNMFSQAGNSSFDFGFTSENPGVIYGKLMKDENTAYRAKIRIGFGSTTNTDQTVDLGGGFEVDSVEIKTSGMNITLGAGLQKYRGDGRLKGFYGAEAMIGLSSGKETWDASEEGENFSVEAKDGSGFNLGIRGFLGVEYFFAPKMSVSGEFGWGLGLNSVGEGELSITSGGETTTTKTGKSSSFGIDTDNAGASINLNFYF